MKNKKISKKVDVKIYHTQKETSRNFIENTESRDIDKPLENAKTVNNEKIIDNIEEEINAQIEKEEMDFLDKFYKKLPDKNYHDIFDDKYLEFFENEENLKLFDKATKLLCKFYNKKENEIIKIYRVKISLEIIGNFDIYTIKIFMDFINLYKKYPCHK